MMPVLVTKTDRWRCQPLLNTSVDLAGQVVFVTGTTSGLGRRFAKVLAGAAGAAVAGASRRSVGQSRGRDRVRRGRAVAVRLDVTDASGISAAVDRDEAVLGAVTILVNNAGIPDAQFATRMSLTLIDAVIDTNLRGPF